MNLKVNMLADITSSDGKRILYSAIKADSTESCSGARYKWLRTAAQPEQRKKLLLKALLLNFSKTRDNYIDEHLINDK